MVWCTGHMISSSWRWTFSWWVFQHFLNIYISTVRRTKMKIIKKITFGRIPLGFFLSYSSPSFALLSNSAGAETSTLLGKDILDYCRHYKTKMNWETHEYIVESTQNFQLVRYWQSTIGNFQHAAMERESRKWCELSVDENKDQLEVPTKTRYKEKKCKV